MEWDCCYACICAAYFKDFITAAEVLNERDPRQQKSLAKKVVNYDQREWNKVSQSVVMRGSLEKVNLQALMKQLPFLGDCLYNVSPYAIGLLSVLFCLSVLSVMLVYGGQTVG